MQAADNETAINKTNPHPRGEIRMSKKNDGVKKSDINYEDYKEPRQLPLPQ